MTDLYAVIGFPIAHSRSPTMMNAAFAALGIDATYAALEVRPDQLRGAIDGIRAQGLAGLNVTIPHKEAILALCDDLAPSARLVGAVNTLARGERGLTGHNTDAAGFVDALGQAGHEPRGGRAVILGAGGAARAVAVGLAGAGAAAITIAARSEDRARSVVQDLTRSPELGRASWSAAGVAPDLAEAQLLVNCTPAGMDGGPRGEDLVGALALERMRRHALVVDLVYRPRVTPLLARARELGLPTLGGSTMLLHQGARAFTIWTGRAAPLDRMREVLESSDR
ncbi:MAG: shikimate dehydrogenase [Deltaproteobacteria bacterium]|nr:shikimate dehydrogenase [Deltaproteobacteria bacterium]